MRYKFIYNGTSIRALMVNFRGTMGYSSSVNLDHTPPPSGWQTGHVAAAMDDNTAPLWDMIGSGSPSETIELRIAWYKVAWGTDTPRTCGGGAYVSATAGAMRPLRWWNDAAPTWGDYKQGDQVDNCLPAAIEAAWVASTAYAVGDYVISDTDRIYVCVKAGTSDTPTGPTGTTNNIVDNTCEWDYVTLTVQSVYAEKWVCETAGALASAWQATTAYVIGDWVENDSGKIYKCVTAGTSDTSGGPTGIGSSITDNTVTWDYHDSEAVFKQYVKVA
jgi:hypothetical protein